MNVGAVIQARCGSTRLPGKVLAPIGGRPLLGYLVESARRAAGLGSVIVATSDASEDDAIPPLCVGAGVACYRGPLDDVAARFVGAMAAHGLDAAVRLNGDSPLLDHRLIERAVRMFRTGDFDLVTNVLPRSFPKGQSVEVFSAAIYRRAVPAMRDPADREHVTRYFYTHPEAFRIGSFGLDPPCPALQLSVDTAEDLERIRGLVARMDRPHWDYSVAELVAMCPPAATDVTRMTPEAR